MTLGELFENQKPITREALTNKGYNITIMQRNSLEKHLVKLVGHGKQFDATPNKVTVKCNPDRPTPSHLIDNIKEYMGSFKKGSALIRIFFTNANPSNIKVDHKKFSGKITGHRVSINQIITSFKNLQCKFLSNLSHIIRSIWILKVAGALTHDSSWSSIFLEGKVLTYSCQLPY